MRVPKLNVPTAAFLSVCVVGTVATLALGPEEIQTKVAGLVLAAVTSVAAALPALLKGDGEEGQ